MSHKITFTYESVDNENNPTPDKLVIHTTNEISWPEILDECVNFLRGCGFVIENKALVTVFDIPGDYQDEEA